MNPLTEENIKEVVPYYGETHKVEDNPIWERLVGTYEVLALCAVSHSTRDLDACLNGIGKPTDEDLNTLYHLSLFARRLQNLMKEWGAEEYKPHEYATAYTLDKLTVTVGRNQANSRVLLTFEVKGLKGIHVLTLNQYMKLLAKLLGK